MQVRTDFTSKSETLALAWKLADQRETHLAHRLFREAVTKNPSMRSFFEYAVFLDDIGETNQAIDLLQQQVEKCLQNSEFKSASLLYNEMASLTRSGTESHMACHYQQLAISCGMRFEAEFECASIAPVSQLGRAHDHILAGEFLAATPLLLSLREHGDEITATSNLILAELYFKTQEIDAAFYVLSEAIEWFESHGEIRSLLKSYALKSRIHQSINEYNEALLSMNSAICIANQYGRLSFRLKDLERYKKQLKREASLLSYQPELN